MDRFAKIWAAQNSISNSSQATPGSEEEQTQLEVVVNQRSTTTAAVQIVVEEVIDLSNLPADPAQRRPIWQFLKTAKVRDDVRRSYLQKDPFQPKNHSFPQTNTSGIPRSFISAWFNKYIGWLENT
jgi:head-tail adaptor